MYNSDYENLLKENIIKNLGWLVEEFDFLFKFKNQKYCQDDKTLANQIITCFSKSLDFTNNEKQSKMLFNALKTLEDLYPMLLKSSQ
ncbi:unnamed protein product [marine sediment metagenome]|uniref:Uncharacterized protein n=1 Tax=marine sediment metagenome TaxID=412755 RepID=X1APT9_9ZZZZ